MAKNLAPAPKSAPMRKLLGKLSRTVDRHQRRHGSFWWLKHSASPLDWAIRAYDILTLRSSRTPRSPALHIELPGSSLAEPGLAMIQGWAYSAEAEFPEGKVEASVDGQDWVPLTNRVPREGFASTVRWARRCGFSAALNTFCLKNGVHRLRVRVKTTSGQVVRERGRSFRVNHVGRLAQVTTGLLKNSPSTKTIWDSLVDSADFPLAQGRDVAWFERSDAENHVAPVIARHNLPSAYESHLHHFLTHGYIVLDQFISKQHCARINRDLEAMLAAGDVRYEWKGQRIERMFKHSRAARPSGLIRRY